MKNSYVSKGVISRGVAVSGYRDSPHALVVISGGKADETKLNGYSYLFISSGGEATSSLLLGNSSYVYVYSAGKAYNTIVAHAHGELFVDKGGKAEHSIVRSGGSVFVARGGSSISSFVESGNITVWGYDNASILNAGTMYLGSTGIALNTTINRRASMSVVQGSVKDAIVNSGGELQMEGYATNIILAGDMFVTNGGTATHTTVNSFGQLHVSSGGAITSSIVNFGGSMVLDRGMAQNTMVNSDGEMYISRGSAQNTIIESGGRLSIHGGEATNTSVHFGGRLDVFVGGRATDITVNSGGYLYIYSGGRIKDVVVSSGGILNGFLLQSSVSFVKGPLSFENAKVQENFAAYLDSGDRAENTIVNSSAYFYVQAGGSAIATTVNWGVLTINSSGFAKNSIINSSGFMYVSLGGTAVDTIVNSGGRVNVCSGGVIMDTVVNSGGSMFISSGGSANSLNIFNNGVVCVERGAVIDKINFVLTQALPSTSMLFNDLSLVSESSNYVITVSSQTKDGIYWLADGAANFDKTISIQNEEETLGTLTIGKTLKIGKASYTLDCKDSQLILSVSGMSMQSTKSDINGNNVSDVMFQYTGGDNQIGFWLDGKDKWQGQGIMEPADWEVIGVYDMDSNGKADIVMLGNTVVGGVRGAYVGFRKDGDTSTWENISFLNNPDNVKWHLKVGNLTGIAGKNSIVWHAPDLGAVGVWTDGTNNWVAISGGFDRNWSLKGTGDFNGDGKDEILFENSGNFYAVGIDSSFNSLGGFGGGWDVRAIGDFNGDGKDDIVLFHKETGSIVRFEDGKATIWSSVGQLDAKDWFIVGAGDYNGDGKDDLLVRQYSTGMLGYYSECDTKKWVEMGRGVDMNWAVIA